MEATYQAAAAINLMWEPVAGSSAYRIYSDMGTGYGVYLYKAEVESNQFTDTNLRAGRRYQYRVGSMTKTGEVTVAVTTSVTAYQPEPRPGDGPDPEKRSPGPADTQAVSQPANSPARVTPAPTPLPPDTIILGLLSANDYVDDVEGKLTIVGEVRNDSHLDVGETTVTATLYGDDGQIIAEASSTTLVGVLAPGVRSPFVINLPRPAGLADYSLRATGRPLTPPPEGSGLSVINTRRFEDTSGFYHIAGVIENRSERRVEGARVIVTLYDRAGRVINVGFAYPQPASLSPQDRADFDVTFTYYPKVYSHQAIVVHD
ncbi:MAG: hypothetical protein Kow0063_06240 [Anaerolineae bacterium]